MHPHNVNRLGLALDDDLLFADLITATRVAAHDLGIITVDVRGPADEADLDLTLIIGRPARHVSLLTSPGAARHVVWSGEPLAVDGGRPRSTTGQMGASRGRATPDSAPGPGVGRLGRWLRGAPLAGPPARWRESMLATRLVEVNRSELTWAASVGAGLVVTSYDRADVLASLGLAAAVVPFGYHPALAGPLVAPDIGPRSASIVTLGAPSRHLRRVRLLAAMAADRNGPRLVALPSVWGPARSDVLREARVLLDVHRVPGTFVGIRLVLALAAGVAVVTEPMPDSRPFVSGVTHLEASTDRLLATARALVADEPRRRALVSAGQALLAERLLLTESLEALLRSSVDAPAAGTSGPPG